MCLGAYLGVYLGVCLGAYLGVYLGAYLGVYLGVISQATMPITRPDVMQACDVMEDVAVAYSINKIKRMTAPTACVGRQNPLQKLTELLRVEMAQV